MFALELQARQKELTAKEAKALREEEREKQEKDTLFKANLELLKETTRIEIARQELELANKDRMKRQELKERQDDEHLKAVREAGLRKDREPNEALAREREAALREHKQRRMLNQKLLSVASQKFNLVLPVS